MQETVDAQKRQLDPISVTVPLRLPDHPRPGYRQVAQVSAFTGERENVCGRVLSRIPEVEAAQLGLARQPDRDRGGTPRQSRAHLGQCGRSAQHAPDEDRFHRRVHGVHDLHLELHRFSHSSKVNALESRAVRILVTGGAGFIGSHVVDAYIAAGHEVAVLDNFSTGRRENLNPKALVHQADLRDQPAVEKVIASFEPEVVNHHAAQSEVPKSVSDPAFDAHVNVLGGVNLLKACIDHAVRKVIFSSTGGALYGEPDIVPAAEDHPVRPLSPYGTSKFAFEQYLATFERTFGLSRTVLRYANIYGERQDFYAEEGRVVAIFASRMLEGRPVTIDGTGSQSRDMLHVGDVATANLAAIDKGAGGTFHISSGVPVTVNDLFRKLALLTEYRSEALHGPARKGDVYRIALDNSLARERLDWEPRITLEEGLSRTVEYFRELVARPAQ
jgi:UDP-glucose 4-epimerase